MTAVHAWIDPHDGFEPVAVSKGGEKDLVIIYESEFDILVSQGHAAYEVDNEACFCAVRLEELCSCRSVIEEIRNNYRSSVRASGLLLCKDAASPEHKPCAGLVRMRLCYHLSLAYSSNGRKGFSSESESLDGIQVNGFFYLGCGMP